MGGRAGSPAAFPRDHGSHPEFRTEWWYVTGWVADAARQRVRRAGHVLPQPSARRRRRIRARFAPRQLAVRARGARRPRHGRLRHDQRAARAGFGLAARRGRRRASGSTTGRSRSTTTRTPRASRRANSPSTCAFAPTQPLLLQGDGGYSRKGPAPAQASYYYSQPQLRGQRSTRLGRQDGAGSPAPRGSITNGRANTWRRRRPAGTGLGINLADGGALMAFRMRDKVGRHALGRRHAARAPGDRAHSRRRGALHAGALVALAAHRRRRTRSRWRAAGQRRWTLEPLFDDQELDSRASTGTIYWEGAVRATTAGRDAGAGTWNSPATVRRITVQREASRKAALIDAQEELASATAAAARIQSQIVSGRTEVGHVHRAPERIQVAAGRPHRARKDVPRGDAEAG